jgi:hypothetical protein
MRSGSADDDDDHDDDDDDDDDDCDDNDDDDEGDSRHRSAGPKGSLLYIITIITYGTVQQPSR